MPSRSGSLTTFAIAALLACCLFLSCNNSIFEREINEGIIEYKVSFPYYDQENIMASMLPEKATLEFKDDKFISQISSGIAFKTTVIGHNSERYLEQMLQMLGKRMVTTLRERDVMMMNGEVPEMTLLFTNETDTVAGYTCKKAIAIFSDISKPEIELYYTDRISLKDPNWHTAFSEIPGVLLKYEFEQYDLRMRLEATSVERSEIPDEHFKIKEGFEVVTPERMQFELQQILETFDS